VQEFQLPAFFTSHVTILHPGHVKSSIHLTFLAPKSTEITAITPLKVTDLPAESHVTCY